MNVVLDKLYGDSRSAVLSHSSELGFSLNFSVMLGARLPSGKMLEHRELSDWNGKISCDSVHNKCLLNTKTNKLH